MDHQAGSRILAYALEAGSRCGSVILIGIDGRSGAGKTTVAAHVSELAAKRGLVTTTVHSDDLCPGWDGLPAVPSRLNAIVEQLALDARATYPTWDWLSDHAGPDAEIPRSDVVILEGVASIDPAWTAMRSVSVWVEAPVWLRKERAIGRDGETFAAYWDAWSASEDRYFAASPPSPDVVVEAN